MAQQATANLSTDGVADGVGDEVLTAMLLAALAVGRSRIPALAASPDQLKLAQALRLLGPAVVHDGVGWLVDGVGIGGLAQPEELVDPGVLAPALAGCLAGHGFRSLIAGLDSRGWYRAALTAMGASLAPPAGGVTVLTGCDHLMPLTHGERRDDFFACLGILLAGLHAPGLTSLVMPATGGGRIAALLAGMGALAICVPSGPDEATVTVRGQPELSPLRPGSLANGGDRG